MTLIYCLVALVACSELGWSSAVVDDEIKEVIQISISPANGLESGPAPFRDSAKDLPVRPTEVWVRERDRLDDKVGAGGLPFGPEPRGPASRASRSRRSQPDQKGVLS